MGKDAFKLLWLVSILVTLSMACSLFSGIGDQVNQARDTAGAVATQVGEGRQLLTTAQALATEAGESGIMQTAQAIATDVGESGLLETAQGFATDEGQNAVQTAQAFATQQGPALLATAQAFATQQGPALVQTSQALATRAASGSTQPPADIPVVGGQTDNFFGSQEAVTYLTPMPFDEVVMFYKAQMPDNGWTASEQGNLETSGAVVLNYQKPDRRAIVSISQNPADNRTIVLVTILPR
jgi:hypothetical protein